MESIKPRLSGLMEAARIRLLHSQSQLAPGGTSFACTFGALSLLLIQDVFLHLRQKAKTQHSCMSPEDSHSLVCPRLDEGGPNGTPVDVNFSFFDWGGVCGQNI